MCPQHFIRRFHEAMLRGDREAVVWGTGAPRLEFMHVDDLADGCLYLMSLYSGHSHVNVGFGSDISIKAFGEAVAAAVGFAAVLRFDASKPDGAPRKLLDVSVLKALGWSARINLKDGLASAYAYFFERSGA